MKKSERSLRFKEHYLENFAKGMRVAEQARLAEISTPHAYCLIHEISDETGISYEELIFHPHTEHVISGIRKELKKVEPINFSKFRKEFKTVKDLMDKNLEFLKEVLEDWNEVVLEEEK